jgi:hypothetical protein
MAPPRRKITEKAPKVTMKTKLRDALPKDLAKALKTRKLDHLTFADLGTIELQLEKYQSRDPVGFFASIGNVACDKERCYCMC